MNRILGIVFVLPFYLLQILTLHMLLDMDFVK